MKNKINRIPVIIITISIILISLAVIYKTPKEVTEESMPEEIQGNRVDISYTYQNVVDSTYKIYAGDVRTLYYSENILRIEYPKYKLESYASELVETPVDYSTSEIISQVLELTLAPQLKITVDTEFGIDEIENTIECLVDQWSFSKDLSREKPETTSDYILDIVIDQGLITEITIRPFDVEHQETDTIYKEAFEKDIYIGEEAIE